MVTLGKPTVHTEEKTHGHAGRNPHTTKKRNLMVTLEETVTVEDQVTTDTMDVLMNTVTVEDHVTTDAVEVLTNTVMLKIQSQRRIT